MPPPRMDIRMIKDVLRLKLHGGLSHEAIGGSLSISKGVDIGGIAAGNRAPVFRVRFAPRRKGSSRRNANRACVGRWTASRFAQASTASASSRMV
jgi:hypothetical protein